VEVFRRVVSLRAHSPPRQSRGGQCERKKNAAQVLSTPYFPFAPLRTPNNFLKIGAKMAGGRTMTIFNAIIPAFPFIWPVRAGHSIVFQRAENGAIFLKSPYL
jgi:hypothetical protein